MIKCSPIETRKNLDAAHAMAKAGIDFVAVPVVTTIDKSNLHGIVQNRFDFLDALTTKDTHGITQAKFDQAIDKIGELIDNREEELDVKPAPESFAKMFNSSKFGQLLALRSTENDQGNPEVRVFCEPQQLGVCSGALIFNDSEAGFDAQEKALRELTLERAEKLVEDIFDFQNQVDLTGEK